MKDTACIAIVCFILAPFYVSSFNFAPLQHRATLRPMISDEEDDGLFLDLDLDAQVLDPQDPNKSWGIIEDSQVFAEPLEKSANEGSSNCTRFVLMSDTHAKHRSIRLPRGNVLIHAGDATKAGEPGTIRDLNLFFHEAKEKFEDVIFVAGNHDITLHTDFYVNNWMKFSRRNKGRKPWNEEEIQGSLTSCTYLRDSSCQTTKLGLEVYGSPWSPTYGCWAFGKERGDAIRQLWQSIPESTDVLVTHGPPLGRGDLTFHSGRTGCLDLLQEVQNRVKPRLHVFGHIHEGHGYTFDGHTLYVNAACVDLRYQPTRFCIVVDVPHDESKPAMIVQPECRIQTPDQFLQWLKQRNFEKLLSFAQESDLTHIPLGNDLFDEETYAQVCSVLDLYRDGDARKEWQEAASQLYSESF